MAGIRLLLIVANLWGEEATWPGGLEYFRLRALQQVDEPALGARVTVDIGLRVLDRTVAGQLLYITQAADRARDIGCERRAAGRPQAAVL